MSEEKQFEDIILEKMNLIKEKIDAKADASEIEKLKLDYQEILRKNEAAVNEETARKQEEFNAVIIKHGEEITKLKTNPPIGGKGYKSLNEAIQAAFMEKAEEIATIVKNGGKQEKSLNISVKAAVVMGNASTIGSGTTQYSLTENTGIISQIRKREMTYLAEVSVGRIGSNIAMWIEETDEQGTPIFIAEGVSKTQLSVIYQEKTASVKKAAVYGKVTTEMMADLPQLISYIENNLMKRLDIVIENNLLTGAAGGDNVTGLKTFATAFSAGALANLIVSANELDVLEAIALQVKTAFGLPKSVFIHPSTMAAIKLIKDSTGRPVWKDYVTIDGSMNISGLKVIESTAVTAGEFIGGDTTVANVLIREDMNIQIGLDGNDFTQNKKTILLEKRLVQFVSANDAPVIVKGTFTAAKAALLKP